jgi:hypothetical protein
MGRDPPGPIGSEAIEGSRSAVCVFFGIDQVGP